MFTTKRAIVNGKEKDLVWIARDDGCFEYIKSDWEQYSSLFLPRVRNWGTVIQAGGNCGLYPLYYASLFERVFTFEPDPMNFFCLSQNCPNSKIVKFNTALGASPGFVSIANPEPNNVGMARVVDSNGTLVYCITIDSLQPLDVGLIHLDVEGFEYPLLRGAINTIEANRPVIVVEITDRADEITSLLSELKYKAVAYYGTPINRVFVPKEWK